MIRPSLAGKRILLTGATGFLGSALLERLVADVGVARVDLLMRGAAEERLSALLRGPLFSVARERHGSGFDALVAERIRLVRGDLGELPPLASDLDLVVHCAATVEFDSAIDEAFATNVVGTLGLRRATPQAGFVHVSTAYVSGLRSGRIVEERLPRFDWRPELDAAEALRTEVERESRRPERLAEIGREVAGELGSAGAIAASRRVEERRREWVRERLVDAGRARARSLGFADVYTFTKAIAEIALAEIHADGPLAIVRPSIIESALVHPFPGWIEGFRMGDPVMLAYGRGLLPEFPGHPDSSIDVVPVDFVVNAILAVAAALPDAPPVVHVASGARNPLRFDRLYEHTRRYFAKFPVTEANRGPIPLPTWTFPGRGAVDDRLRAAERWAEIAERALDWLPRTSLSRRAAESVDRRRRDLDVLLRYGELYGPYTSVGSVFDDRVARELLDSLDDDDRREFGFDVESFDWKDYLETIHLPAVAPPGRPTGGGRPPRVTAVRRAAESEVVLAVFDVEGTILDTNVVETYAWLRIAERGEERLRHLAALLGRLPAHLREERRDRGAFLRAFYRQYAGADAERLRETAASLADRLLARLAPAAVRRIREHRRAGHEVVFLTGALDFWVRPLAPLASRIVAGRLEERAGLFTGRLAEAPLVGEARGAWLREHARERGADLRRAHAYADSLSDLSLLEAVGHPAAVNPEVRLDRLARRRRWPVVEWRSEQTSLAGSLLERWAGAR